MTPINKQASIFLSKKPRVETLSEALEKFALKLTSPGVADEIKKLIHPGSRCGVRITVSIRGDARVEGLYHSQLKTFQFTDLGEESYSGLK
jgi:hypothetical protein